MKKFIGVMTASLIAVGLVACGGETQEVEESKAAEVVEEQTVEQVEMVTKQFDNISVDVPSTFSEVAHQEEMYIVSGPNASLAVATLPEVELLPSEWNESLASETLEMFYGDTYSNVKLAAYEGNINVNGNSAVYYSFYGMDEQEDEHLVHIIRLFNTDITTQYLVTYIHLVEDEFYDADVNAAIINSITLSD